MHMASEALALRPQLPDDDYRALYAALETSARGRAFLAEHVRRNRKADTQLVLAAVDRLSAQMRVDAAAIADLRNELRALLSAIRLARPDIDAGQKTHKPTMLSGLVGLLEQRIGVLVDSKLADRMRPDTREEPARAPLAIVPAPEEPELLMPSAQAKPPAIAVVREGAWQPGISSAAMPEVNVFDSPPAAARPAAEKPDLKPNLLRGVAPIMALSEDERLALFS
jgi:hypothetical protein